MYFAEVSNLIEKQFGKHAKQGAVEWILKNRMKKNYS